MSIILASLPILLVLILMIGFSLRASSAGSLGYILAILISIFFFGADPQIIVYAHFKAFFLALDVLLIVWAAFLLYKVADEAGAIAAIGDSLRTITQDKTKQSLLLGWVFASILQGVGGFGVPVAVIAPILIGLGFPPLSAVVIPSIGHGWAVTFGSLGSSFNAMLAATGLDSGILAPFAAFFLGIAGILSGWLISIESGGKPGLKKNFLLVLFVGSIMGAAQFFTANSQIWNIASLAGGAAGAVAILPIILRSSSPNRAKVDWKHFALNSSNYLILIGLILIIKVTPGLNVFLEQIKIQASIPRLETNLGYITEAGNSRSIPILTHAGTILMAASAIGFLLFKQAGFYQPGTGKRIISETRKRMMGGTISILTMVAMASIMEVSGMTYLLAQGMSRSLAAFFPLLSPWIGAMGSFISGSNTNSNVLFSVLQMNTAELLSYPIPVILAAQTAGAALASVMAPTKIVVGASTTGLAGKEGKILKKLACYTLILVATISGLTVLSIWITG